MSGDRPVRRKWIAPSSGGYSGLSKAGRPVRRPPVPPKMPATKEPEPAEERKGQD